MKLALLTAVISLATLSTIVFGAASTPATPPTPPSPPAINMASIALAYTKSCNASNVNVTY